MRVLQWRNPTIDMSLIKTELDRLWANIDSILATPVIDPQSTPSELGDDSVIGALVSGDEQPEPTLAKWKKHHSSRKHERMEAEEAKRSYAGTRKWAKKKFA